MIAEKKTDDTKLVFSELKRTADITATFKVYLKCPPRDMPVHVREALSFPPFPNQTYEIHLPVRQSSASSEKNSNTEIEACRKFRCQLQDLVECVDRMIDGLQKNP